MISICSLFALVNHFYPISRISEDAALHRRDLS